MLLFFLRARLLRKQQLATVVANVRRSSMSARPRRHLRLPLPKHLAPSRIKTFFNRSVLLFFLRARLLRKRQLATSVANVRRSSMSACPGLILSTKIMHIHILYFCTHSLCYKTVQHNMSEPRKCCFHKTLLVVLFLIWLSLPLQQLLPRWN